MYKCSCGFETEKGNAYSAHFTHYKGDDRHKRLGWMDPATGELFATRPTATRAIKPPPEPKGTAGGEKPVVQRGVVQVAALSSGKAPVLFQLAQETIPVDFGDLYECFLLYNDMKTRGVIAEDGFCATLKDGIALLWTIGVGQPQIDGGKVLLAEVKDGGSSGDGKEEARVEQATAAR
jgi:hypothetical protein